MKNAIYKRKGDYEYTERKATKKELAKARKDAVALMKKTNGEAMGMRSCWVCNAAHTHFLHGKWGDWVLRCFGDCGRVYFNKIDITDYEENN